MKSWFGRFTPVLFIFVFLFTAFSLFTIFSNVSTLRNNEQLVDHTRIVQNAIDTLELQLIMETAQQRAYLLTGQQQFLQAYTTITSRTPNQLTRLQQLTQDNPIQQKHIQELQKIIAQRNTLLQQEIQLHDQQGSQLVLEAASVEEVSPLTTQVRQIIQQMDAEELRLLQIRKVNSQNEYRIIYTNTVLTFLGDVFLLSLMFYFLRKELQQRTEMDKTKDDFINLASHELNTPITSLKIFSKVLRSKVTPEKATEIKRYLDKIDEQTNKLTMLITDLLDISRIQTGKIRIDKEKFNLSSLITDTIEGIQGTTHIHTIVTNQHFTKDVYADRYRIYQVLVNLLTNAIKYSPKGGDIVVKTVKKGKEVIISVADSGIGIDKKFQQKIFERLYQVPDSKEKTFPGLGIGLFISREIIRMHDGRMWVESTKGKGSTFYFTLPA